WPARLQPWLRPNLVVDLQFYLGQAFIFGALATLALTWVRHGVDLGTPLALRDMVQAQPAWLHALLAVVLGDLGVYWFHRASHRYAWLWRFHRVHHTSSHLDWLAAHREHPVDGLLTQLVINGPAMLLGVPMTLLVPLAIFRGLWAIFIHSNARLPLGPLRYLLGAPELHHWHHAKHPSRVTNFANLAPWCDLLFGTFHLPPGDVEQWELGDPDPSPQSWWRLILEPLGFPRSTGVSHRGVDTDLRLTLRSPPNGTDRSDEALSHR
ncbi:MAG: sterol desaturase family protein, partial [Archangium sp.]|nr:sterol desaturase family protein [Archangium sp.]